MARTRSHTLDAALILKDTGAIATSAAAQVGGADKIIDLGGATSTEGMLILDVTAIDLDAGNEIYTVSLQASNSASFASGNVTLAEIRLGDSSLNGKSADDTVGRYLLPFITNQDDTEYRYLRAYTTCVGVGITTGLNYTAWISKGC